MSFELRISTERLESQSARVGTDELQWPDPVWRNSSVYPQTGDARAIIP